MEIDSSQQLSADVGRYITDTNSKSSKPDQLLFGVDKSVVSSGSSIISAKKDEEVVGVLVSKRTQINKKTFTSVAINLAEEASVASELIGELLKAYKGSASKGIITSTMPNDHVFTSQYQKHKFKPYGRLFVTDKSTSPISSSLLSFVKLSSRNRSEYTRPLTDMLTKFDSQLFQGMNKTIGEPLYSTSIGNRAHQIKLSYFIKTLINSSDWCTLMIHLDEELVGFVKGKVRDNDSICDVDIFLPDKDLDKYAGKVIQEFGNHVKPSVTKLAYTTYDKNSKMMSMCNRVFGKSVGVSFNFT